MLRPRSILAANVWFALLLGFIAVNGTASSNRGVVAGTVLDDRGGPLPGARVEIAGPSRASPETSGGMGFFHFPDLAAGEYTITISHPSFPSVVQHILVRAGETTTMSVQLRGGH